eukprot:Nitzschia sp. Nitz4//scaffold65_size103378//61251//62531//NITZ4_004470-RA/size103378-snap-gene-0.13-mRNA-1//-1//CDS//3329556252//4680//frame0
MPHNNPGDETTMAGTRLFLQRLDNWWQTLWTQEDAQLVQLPNVTLTTPSLPLVQVNKFLQKHVGLDWKKNPNTIIICTQPESPVVQGQVLWWCPTTQEAPRTRVVVRKSSTVVFSAEKDLSSILKPDKLPLPFTLHVHLVLESTEKVAQKAQLLSQEFQEPISNLTHWPCVNSLQVQMHVVPPLTSRWVSNEKETTDGEADPSILRSLTTSQANRLLATLEDPSEDDYALYIYIPANPVEKPLTYQLEGKNALLTVGWDSLPVHQWLAETMGLPIPWLDTDGSFPRWFEEWYWYTTSFQLTSRLQQDFSKVQHLLQHPLEEWKQAASLQEHFEYLCQLQSQLHATLTTARLEPEFPLEHYAAIFAPLLFPLLLPFFLGVLKEYRRYKEKIGSTSIAQR